MQHFTCRNLILLELWIVFLFWLEKKGIKIIDVVNIMLKEKYKLSQENH